MDKFIYHMDSLSINHIYYFPFYTIFDKIISSSIKQRLHIVKMSYLIIQFYIRLFFVILQAMTSVVVDPRGETIHAGTRYLAINITTTNRP